MVVERMFLSEDPMGCSVADPGFPVGGGADPLGGGRRPPTHTLFGKNECENKRNGSCWGGGGAPAASPLDPPMDV